MKLGSASQITLGATDLLASEAFWLKLGFRKIGEGSEPYPWIQLTDGSLLLLLNRDKKEYMALTYFDRNMAEKVEELDSSGIPLDDSIVKGNTLVQGTIETGDGIEIQLVNFDPVGFYQPTGKTLRHMGEADFADPSAFPNPKIGVFGEISLPVSSLEKSLTWWRELGFEKLGEFEQPYPWAILADDFHIIGLHQSTHFRRPAITYFAPDMKLRIARLQEAGLKPEGFRGADVAAGNAVLRSPEGQTLFLFSFGGV